MKQIFPGDHADSETTGYLRKAIQEVHPGRLVQGVRVGESEFQDIENSFFMPINEQVSLVCQQLINDSRFSNGIHMVGLSQGGLFVRALVQRCPFKRVGAVVSIGGPQRGIYGFPRCPEQHIPFSCSFLRAILNYLAYSDKVQGSLVQAQYWHDPTREELYKEKSLFLSDINQEKKVNDTYRKHMELVDALVLVKFQNDTIVVPRESTWFGFYKTNSTDHLYDLRESTLYSEDLLGLKKLDLSGKLHLLETPGEHLHFSLEWFKEKIVIPFLK
ncbi:Palmitoyl-protein thioesterase [Fasciola hepatica]|uniref:Palmitoyl-protein thioesterase 1 n=1 Tax=Fasciola hepatica TaxID=6192 RepID=A0A4E0R363_FASHE|nr:Palmitoyl-protein thioesterase [Fasciola hepatica]